MCVARHLRPHVRPAPGALSYAYRREPVDMEEEAHGRAVAVVAGHRRAGGAGEGVRSARAGAHANRHAHALSGSLLSCTQARTRTHLNWKFLTSMSYSSSGVFAVGSMLNAVLCQASWEGWVGGGEGGCGGEACWAAPASERGFGQARRVLRTCTSSMGTSHSPSYVSPVTHEPTG